VAAQEVMMSDAIYECSFGTWRGLVHGNVSLRNNGTVLRIAASGAGDLVLSIKAKEQRIPKDGFIDVALSDVI